MKKALILGAGFSGCTIAYLLKEKGWDCTIVEKEGFMGGSVRTFFMGGHPYTLGPRVYYGYSEKIWNWLDSFIEMRRFPLFLQSYVESEKRFFTYPIHEDDIPMMKVKDQVYKELKERDLKKQVKNFEEYWQTSVGPTLYDMFVNQYSKKMWMIDSNTKLDTFKWSAKDKPLATGVKDAYKGSVMGYPVGHAGYNPYFDVATQGVKVHLNEAAANVDLAGRSVTLSTGEKINGDILISSIPIDELWNYSQGELPYVGRDFIPFVLPCKQVFPLDVRFAHYTGKEPYTRIVEYKKLTYHEAEDTLLVMEIPSKSNKLYPYMIKEHLDKAKRYCEALPKDVYSIGRLGIYKYTTIEQTICGCFGLYKDLTGESIDGLEKEFYQIGDTGIMKNRKTGDKPSNF